MEKVIKKSDWKFRFIRYTFPTSRKIDWVPLNICDFYWHLFLSFLIFPITKIAYVIELLTFLEKPSRYNYEKKWEKLTNDLLIIVVSLALCFILNILLLLMLDFLTIEIPESAVKMNNPNAILTFSSMFVYPLITGIILKFKEKIKTKLCRPIRYE